MLEKTFAHPLARLLLLLAAIGGVYFGYGVFAQTSAYSDTDATYNVAYWKQQIERKDPTEVYATFSKQNAKAPQARQHLSAHVMGGLLADALGTKGITVCDASFGFGCFHGFFARLISSTGTSAIRSLDAECIAKFGPFGTGCQHGIGHGLLEYVGYQNLSKALELCKETTQQVPLLGCVTGVFMEYNTPLAGAESGLVPKARVFDPLEPYEPCTSVAAEYQSSCYLEIGHWLAASPERDTAVLGYVCGGAPLESRKYCFLGLGDSMAAQLSYSIDDAITFCEGFTGDGTLYCRAGVSWSFFANPDHRALAQNACAFADQSRTKECLALADLTEGQANQ